jgi:hypothetical protein
VRSTRLAQKIWLFTDFWNLLKERQPQGGFTIDSRGFQPAAMNAVTHIFQKTVMNQKSFIKATDPISNLLF